jgi:hypothetical protein
VRRWRDEAPPRRDGSATSAGLVHDFENRISERAGLLNFRIPGGSEGNMPAIVGWFNAHRLRE